MSIAAEEKLKAPFPWFGGKSQVADVIWRAFGDVPNYVEPFFGSGAVLLGRPQPFYGVETINDADGFVANFWRAVQADPEAVANWADNPVFENDLHARHYWLVERKESLQATLEGDPEWYDAKIAGWWCWGMACWIGSGFASGKGPWRVVEQNGQRNLVHLSNAGQGVNRQLVHLGNAGRGVNRQLVHLSDAGRGVNRKLVHLSDAGKGVNRKLVHLSGAGQGVRDWMAALAERFLRVRVCCGDWTRVCGGKSGDALKVFFAGGNQCAVLLDPPYSAEAGRDNNLYRCEDVSVAHAVREWCIRHGDDRRLRIALCGYDGEHAMPAGWKCHAWKACGGYSSVSKGDTRGKANAHREVVWFSPHCIDVNDREAVGLFD